MLLEATNQGSLPLFGSLLRAHAHDAQAAEDQCWELQQEITVLNEQLTRTGVPSCIQEFLVLQKDTHRQLVPQ